MGCPPSTTMKASKGKGRLKRVAGKARAWWQGRGTEVCAHCARSYHYEMEYRCVECDRGVCALCAVTERETVYCPECV